MTRRLLTALATGGCAILVGVPAVAANHPAATAHKATTKAAMEKAWPAETLSGRIMMVDPGLKLAVVKGPDGVPFDLIVTHKTQIESGSQRLKLLDLTSDTNKGVSVKFVPEQRGDVARVIQITG